MELIRQTSQNQRCEVDEDNQSAPILPEHLRADAAGQ